MQCNSHEDVVLFDIYCLCFTSLYLCIWQCGPAPGSNTTRVSVSASLLVPGDVMLRLAWLLLWAMVCLPSYGWVEGWRHTQCLSPLLFLYNCVMVQEERWLLQPRALLLPAAQLHDVRLHRKVHKAQGL